MSVHPPFKHKTNWVVITGAPSSGKTSVIEELAHRGYAIQNEVAREYIEECLNHGRSLEDVRGNTAELQENILKLKTAREMALDTETLVFMDRGMGDSVAYFELAGMDTVSAQDVSFTFKYRAVFIFDRLPLVKDNVRTEDEAMANKLDGLLEDAYKAQGYEPIRVPVVSIEERADFILAYLAR